MWPKLYIESTCLLVYGIFKRWYAWVSVIIFFSVDPINIYSNTFASTNAEGIKSLILSYIPENAWVTLSICILLIATVSTYHEARVRGGAFFSSMRPLLTLVLAGKEKPHIIPRTFVSPNGELINCYKVCFGVKSKISTAEEVELKLDYIESTDKLVGKPFMIIATRDQYKANLSEGDVELFHFANIWASSGKGYAQKIEQTTENQFARYKELEEETFMLLETQADGREKEYLKRGRSATLYMRITSKNVRTTYCVVRVESHDPPNIHVVCQRLCSYPHEKMEKII